MPRVEALQARTLELSDALKELKKEQSIITQQVESLKIKKDEQNDTLVR